MRIRASSCAASLVLLGIASTAFSGGGVDRRIGAKSQVLKQDVGAGGTAKLATIVNKNLFNDPFNLPTADPTVVGGRLRFFSTLQSSVSPDVLLPASGWKGLGNPAGSQGWKYTGAGSVSDPCKVVIVKAKVIKAVCKGPGAFASPAPYGLPLSSGAGAAWEIVIGADRYCALSSSANSDIKQNDGIKGIFKAVNAIPAEGQTCPGCDHGVCFTGNALTAACSPCAAIVCAGDPSCCNVAWDASCVADADSACGGCSP